jgi:hypothetical protein
VRHLLCRVLGHRYRKDPRIGLMQHTQPGFPDFLRCRRCRELPLHGPALLALLQQVKGER